jgi:hypothetical protein
MITKVAEKEDLRVNLKKTKRKMRKFKIMFNISLKKCRI